jgi:hypothetical protein
MISREWQLNLRASHSLIKNSSDKSAIVFTLLTAKLKGVRIMLFMNFSKR